MMHKPIQIKNLSLSFSHKTCFDDFSIQIEYGSRIAIIGRNGIGKSTLLNMLQDGDISASKHIIVPENVVMGYVPQIIEEFHTLSGGQRFNAMLTNALKHDPNVLLLDEPTNHLDQYNRASLIRLLQNYSGTLLLVSHDAELLRSCVNTLWHIDNGSVQIFHGNYDDYLRELRLRRNSLEQELTRLHRQKNDLHQTLMQEQQRAAKSKAKGAKSIGQRKWPTVVSAAKAGRGSEASGRKKMAIAQKKQNLTEQLTDLRLPEVILPRFNLNGSSGGSGVILSIRQGSVGYLAGQPILSDINLSLNFADRMAITGNNGSGKSTLVKAILNDEIIIRSGNWYAPKFEKIGYLDQHYCTLSTNETVFESVAELVPAWSHVEIRRHLADFLFRKNEEVNAKIKTLSGGERMRVSLAKIAAKIPELLILDEITNNIDLETRQQVVDVLKSYPGTVIVISHDEDFLKNIGVGHCYFCNRS